MARSVSSRINDIRRRIIILTYKSSHPCIICGETNPVLLDLHHPRGVDKHSQLKKGTHRSFHHLSIPLLAKEISKCVAMCTKCHRLRTAQEFEWPTLEKCESDLAILSKLAKLSKKRTKYFNSVMDVLVKVVRLTD